MAYKKFVQWRPMLPCHNLWHLKSEVAKICIMSLSLRGNKLERENESESSGLQTISEMFKDLKLVQERQARGMNKGKLNL